MLYVIRIILLRVLLASWLIPLSWIICFPIGLLLFGGKEAIKITTDFNYVLWYGDIRM